MADKKLLRKIAPIIMSAAVAMTMKLKNGFGIILRAYDEGVAYRFYTQRKGKTIILNETAAYQFGKDGYPPDILTGWD